MAARKLGSHHLQVCVAFAIPGEATLAAVTMVHIHWRRCVRAHTGTTRDVHGRFGANVLRYSSAPSNQIDLWELHRYRRSKRCLLIGRRLIVDLAELLLGIPPYLLLLSFLLVDSISLPICCRCFFLIVYIFSELSNYP